MKPLRVLAVDDSRTMLDMLRAGLERAGFEVIEAEDGVQGLAKLAGNSVDCIITDVNMPNMDGLEFTRRVRADVQKAQLPILILTTETSREKRDIGRAAGATGWITKPVDADQLAQVVKRVCG